MLDEDWRGLSVLYVCPLKALLNNLHEPRLDQYLLSLVGRACGLWHGDVGPAARKRLISEPLRHAPDHPRVDRGHADLPGGTSIGRSWRNVRVVIVDEIHAFAG